MKDKKILVTSGPTRANVDAVRFISNRSSGRLGAEIVCEAVDRGACVTLVAGPDSAKPPVWEWGKDKSSRLKTIDIETVQDVFEVLQNELKSNRRGRAYDAVVHAMAVLDYQPVDVRMEKVRSGKDCWTIPLKKTPKIISHLKVWSPDSILVAFKLESGVSEGEMRKSALSLLRSSRAELVVANDLQSITGGAHPALILDQHGRVVACGRTKREIALRICETVSDLIRTRGPRPW